MTVREAKSLCRICMAGCATVLKIDENEHIVSIRGDHDDPMSQGYACFKGLQAEESHHGCIRSSVRPTEATRGSGWNRRSTRSQRRSTR